MDYYYKYLKYKKKYFYLKQNLEQNYSMIGGNKNRNKNRNKNTNKKKLKYKSKISNRLSNKSLKYFKLMTETNQNEEYLKYQTNQTNQTNQTIEHISIPTLPLPTLPLPTYTEHLSEPWFTLISLGLKTVEGRKNKGRFKDMNIGEIIKWTNNDFAPTLKERTILTQIVSKSTYKTFNEYLNMETLEKCLPGINSLEDGINIYYKYFTKDDEKTYGVVAIGLKLI
jgi:ASC-1-like (ASCH) protein